MKNTHQLRRAAAVLLSLSTLLSLGIPAASAEVAPGTGPASRPQLTKLTLGEDVGPTRIPRKRRSTARSGSAALTTSNFVVNYDSNFLANTAARNAFEYAIGIWEQQVFSTVPIEVDASFVSLGATTLGEAGPVTQRRNFTNAPVVDTMYPIALANSLAGSDLNNGASEITAQFSSDRTDWYFGTDGLTPAGKVDFVTVVLHELGHGLGFLGGAYYNDNGGPGSDTGEWAAGLVSGGVITRYLPFAFDLSVHEGTSASNVFNSYSAPSTELAAAFRSNNLFWNGAFGKAANAGARVKLYVPASWVQGSSYSHLDEATFGPTNPNALMTPTLGFQQSAHDPGPIARGMMRDMGWKVDSDGDGVTDDTDNCVTVANAGQQNTDGDAVGDACDLVKDMANTDQFYSYIRALQQSTITVGCDGDAGLFCPHRNVTRAQMAIFLVRALGQESTLGTTAPAPWDEFNDVVADGSPSWYAPYVERLKQLGITVGCNGGVDFCPHGNVTRMEMAIFLTRAIGTAQEKADAAAWVGPSTSFTDVPANANPGFIEFLKSKNITSGYGDGRYGPFDLVTRAQMAKFLTVGFGLPVPAT